MLRSLLVFLTTPSNFLVVLLVAGLLMLMLRWRRTGAAAVGFGVLGLLGFGYSSAGELLMAPLVSRFPPVALEAFNPPHHSLRD